MARELDDLKDIDIITFDVIILQAFVYYAQQNDNLISVPRAGFTDEALENLHKLVYKKQNV